MQANATEAADAVGCEIDITIVGGRGLVAKDRSAFGKKSSDPYVVISCGKRTLGTTKHGDGGRSDGRRIAVSGAGGAGGLSYVTSTAQLCCQVVSQDLRNLWPEARRRARRFSARPASARVSLLAICDIVP